VVDDQVDAANEKHSEMWLTGAVRVIFMSYYGSSPKCVGRFGPLLKALGACR